MSQGVQKDGGSTNAFQISTFSELSSVASSPIQSSPIRRGQPGRIEVHLNEGVALLDGPNSAIVVGERSATKSLTIRGGGQVLWRATLEFLNGTPNATTTADFVVQSVGPDRSRIGEALALFESDRAIPWRKIVSAKLRALLVEYRQDHDGTDFSFESLLAFHEFCQLASGIRMPFLTVTEGGELYARWKRSHDEVLSLRFFGCTNVSFVLFKPVDGSVDRQTGRVATTQLTEAISPQSLSWVKM